MGFAVNVVTEPTAEPVALADLKAYLRVSITDDDDLITSLGKAARRLIERTYDCSLMQQTLELTLDRFPFLDQLAWPSGYQWGWFFQRIPMDKLVGVESWAEREAIRLPRPPLQSVSSIDYTAMDGTSSSVDSADYVVDAKRSPGRVAPGFGKRWPFTQWTLNAVTVQYVAGYASAADVPDTYLTAIKLAVIQWYDNRRAAGDLPEAARRLLMAEWDGEYY